MMFGMCLPDTCSPAMAKQIVEKVTKVLRIRDIGFSIVDQSCQVGDDTTPFSVGEIITM